MENLNENIKSALKFISVIQDICDKKRLDLETLKSQSYSNYVKERKQEQKAAISIKEANSIKLEKSIPDVTEDMKELALVDSLLEKAATIRNKTKVISKEKNCAKLSPNPPLHVSKPISIVTTKSKKTLSHTANESNGNKKVLPRSKSAFTSVPSKTVVVPRSKSANVRSVPKDQHIVLDSFKKNNENKKDETGNIYLAKTSIVSSKDLIEYKKFCKDRYSCDTKLKPKEISKAGFSQNVPDQWKSLTFRKFQSSYTCPKSSLKLKSSVLWYPNLSATCHDFLFAGEQRCSLKNLKKAYKLIFVIQETMLWIDLISLLGKEAISSIHLVKKKNWDFVRVLSYLEAVCDENLQRTPIVDTS